MNPQFRRRLASHNRHAVIAAILSLLGAWLAWTIAFGLLAGITLGLLTIIQGQEVIAGEKLIAFPEWLRTAALAAALASLVWAAVDERKHRYHPVGDRPVVGWHILGDILLLPARLTFGVGHQLAAIIRLSRSEQQEACNLLHHIHTEKRCPAHSLGAWFANPKRLHKILTALQLAGWIDLLRTEDGWIYIERSCEAAGLAKMFDEAPGETTTPPAEAS